MTVRSRVIFCALSALVVGGTGVLAGCGHALPSAAPLSTSHRDPLARTRPASVRAAEPGTEERPSVENEAPPPSSGDDDDDSSSRAPASGTNLIRR